MLEEIIIALIVFVAVLFFGGCLGRLIYHLIHRIRCKYCKITSCICAVLLPTIVFIVIYLYQGVVVCTYCGSFVFNKYTTDHWITTHYLCEKCVKYIYCVDSEHMWESPKRPEVCTSCEGFITCHNEDDFFYEIVFNVLYLSFFIACNITLFVSIIITLCRNKMLSPKSFKSRFCS